MIATNDRPVPLNPLPNSSGVWAGLVPELTVGGQYRYLLETHDGGTIQKTDPMAFAVAGDATEWSVVSDLRTFQWTDADWMARRQAERRQDFRVYKVDPEAWRSEANDETAPSDYQNYRQLAYMLADFVRTAGYTHVQVLPVNDESSAATGNHSPFFAVDGRLGAPADFQYFVDYLHARDIGVVCNWVPAEFPAGRYGLTRFDGTPLYEWSAFRNRR